MQTESMTLDRPNPAPPASPGSSEDPPISLAEEGVLKGVCLQHGHDQCWRNTEPTPLCPDCGQALTVTAATARTAEEAIAAAAQEMPDKVEPPHQPVIPGLRPAFNFQAAFESIIDQRRVVRSAEANAESKASIAKFAKKRAEEEQATLSQLEDDFEQRSRDERYESPASGDATPVDQVDVVPMAAPHRVSDDGTESCVDCGALLHPLATELGQEALLPGQLVGTDCPGPPERNTLEELQHVLAQATQHPPIALDVIAGWTPEQCDEASRWASEQLQATAQAGPGHTVSIAWPAHVSAAVYGSGSAEPARRANPRHGTKEARQTARNAATKAERAEKAERRPKGRTPLGAKRSQPGTVRKR